MLTEGSLKSRRAAALVLFTFPYFKQCGVFLFVQPNYITNTLHMPEKIEKTFTDFQNEKEF